MMERSLPRRKSVGSVLLSLICLEYRGIALFTRRKWMNAERRESGWALGVGTEESPLSDKIAGEDRFHNKQVSLMPMY